MRFRRLLIPALLLACSLPAWAGAGERGDAAASAQRFTLRLTAGNASNEIEVRVSADGSQYVITANGAIPPAAGCRNPPGEPTELRCARASIAAIVVEANGGNDTIAAARACSAYMLLSGGAGFDDLIGGANADEIRGGPGPDAPLRPRRPRSALRRRRQRPAPRRRRQGLPARWPRHRRRLRRPRPRRPAGIAAGVTLLRSGPSPRQPRASPSTPPSGGIAPGGAQPRPQTR